MLELNGDCDQWDQKPAAGQATANDRAVAVLPPVTPAAILNRAGPETEVRMSPAESEQ